MRRAFSLVELLIVISVIALLAGMAFPAFGMVRRMARDVTCTNNLKQLGLGIETYRQEYEDLFPPLLRNLFDPTKDGRFALAEQRVMVCPNDPSKGKNYLNRQGLGNNPLNELWEQEVQPTPTITLSYLNEVSGTLLDPSQYSWFLTGDEETAVNQPPPQTVSWSQGKARQVKSGHPGTIPFPESFFPILRCYWHEQWTQSNASSSQKVNNLSWNLAVFKSIPYWEHQINPAIPLP